MPRWQQRSSAEGMPELAARLEFPVDFTLADNPYGFGAHVAVVEVDRDTGALKMLRYVAVHDCGRVINPKLLEGQVYGAIAQGMGQALCEGMHYSEAASRLLAVCWTTRCRMPSMLDPHGHHADPVAHQRPGPQRYR